MLDFALQQLVIGVEGKSLLPELKSFLWLPVHEVYVAGMVIQLLRRLLTVGNRLVDIGHRLGVILLAEHHPSIGVKRSSVVGTLLYSSRAHLLGLVKVAAFNGKIVGAVIKCEQIVGVDGYSLVILNKCRITVALGVIHIAHRRHNLRNGVIIDRIGKLHGLVKIAESFVILLHEVVIGSEHQVYHRT